MFAWAKNQFVIPLVQAHVGTIRVYEVSFDTSQVWFAFSGAKLYDTRLWIEHQKFIKLLI
jgi:hypothetical protein